MADRTAIDTIKGYFYQFDYSIDQILNLDSDTDSIVIEGIEDVDIKTATDETAVQCKYYSKSEYNHSVIAEPIRLMLDHFAEVKKGTKARINYKLRGHYKSGQSKLTLPLDISTLKDNFLFYKKDKVRHEHHTELGLTDTDLTDFISLLEIDINAKDLDKQFKDLIAEFRKLFSCSEFTSEYFYYNNALRVIKELSIKPAVIDRTIIKKDFLSKINTSKILFNEWFVKFKGEKLHFQNLKKEYFTFLNVSPFERFFLIEIDSRNYLRGDIKELLFIISRKWSKVSKREPKPFCPYVYIHGINPSELIELKKEMISEDFFINDGHDFEGAEFNPNSIIRRADSYNQIKLKILNSLSHIDLTISKIPKTKEVYQFYILNSYYTSTNPALKHIQIQVDKIQNIKHIL